MEHAFVAAIRAYYSNGVDFIEPLDVSTIFRNGLDNAIEDNCLQDSGNTKSRTTKNDDFLHGFGISNMRKAVEKYDGQLMTKCENGKFTLKILILIP